MATSEKSENLKGITPIGTLCFPHLFTPHAFEGGAANYSAILCFPPDTDLKEIQSICLQAAIKKFGSKDKIKAMKLRWPWRDGTDYAEYGEPFVEGSKFINLKSKQAPGVVNARAKPVMNDMDVYAGCQARASFLAWAYDNMGNKGVTLLLNNLQMTGPGTRLSGRVNAEDEFDAIPGSDKATATTDAGLGDDDDSPF